MHNPFAVWKMIRLIFDYPALGVSFLAVFIVLALFVCLAWLWENYPPLGMSATMVLTVSLVIGAINAMRRSRQRHLAYEAMLAAERAQEGDGAAGSP
jgi:multisubunit Na+/H+ antiporter MnhB subunit